MQAIQPLTITDSILTSSNVAENDYGEWASGTTYSLGDRVIVVSVHKVYESASNSNIGNDPTTDDGTNWILVGATNRWKAFDQKLSDPVTNANSITYTLTTTQSIVNSLAFFNLSADSVQITVTPSGSGSPVYDETFFLLDTTSVIDWYTYFFEPATTKEKELLVTNLPYYPNAVVAITISDAGETAKVGQIVLGSLVSLGRTGYGTTVGIEDYSTKERDTFGNAIIVQRAFAQKADYEVEITTQDTRRVQRFLATYRATPVVWIGNQDPSYGLIVYGFYTQFSINLATPSVSYTTLEVEGLT
jgi:hypothetical protein